MKKLLSLTLISLLTGCVQTWYKPGATQTEFNSDDTYCRTVAFSYAPPNISQVEIGNGYVEPAMTNCNGSIMGSNDGYGGVYGTTTNNCTTTGGRYVPPPKISVDNNSQARKAAYTSCLYNKGWTTVKPAEIANAESSQRNAPSQQSNGGSRLANLFKNLNNKDPNSPKGNNQNQISNGNSITNSNDSKCDALQTKSITDNINRYGARKDLVYSYINNDENCRYSVSEANGLFITSYLVNKGGNSTAYQDGPTTFYWSPNGNKKEEKFYTYNPSSKSSSVNGIVTAWYKNGAKRSEVNYTNGIAEGIETTWDENGSKISEVKYHNGLQVINGASEKVGTSAKENKESQIITNKDDEFSLLMTQTNSLDSTDFIQIGKTDTILLNYYINKNTISKRGNLFVAISKSIKTNGKDLSLSLNYYNCDTNEVKYGPMITQNNQGEFKQFDPKSKWIKITNSVLENAESNNLTGALGFKFVCSNTSLTEKSKLPTSPKIKKTNASTKLQELKDLLDKKLITKEDYENKKAKILESL